MTQSKDEVEMSITKREKCVKAVFVIPMRDLKSQIHLKCSLLTFSSNTIRVGTVQVEGVYLNNKLLCTVCRKGTVKE